MSKIAAKSCSLDGAAAAGESGGGGREGREDALFMSKFMEVEFEVAGILLDLPKLFPKCDTPLRSSSGSWGCKKKRSEPPSVAAAAVGAGRAEGPFSKSPTSPLDFKTKASITKASTLTSIKESLQNEHDRLTKEREKLMGEFAKIQSRRTELMAENLILKEKRQKLQSVSEERPPNQIDSAQSQLICPDAAGGSIQGGQVVMAAASLKIPYQLAFIARSHLRQPLVVNRQTATVGPSQQLCEVYQYHHHHQQVGPTSVPDLNVSTEEYAAMKYSQPLDLDSYHYSKMAAKERRRNRVMMVQKRKRSSKSALGT